MLPLQRPQIGQQELTQIGRVFDSRWLGMGQEVKEFELALGKYIGNPNILATNTGTSALHLALASCQFEPGSEVIVPSLTFIATIQAIIAAGLFPVFADVDPVCCNIDPQSIERCISEKTCAIMPVHYRGHPCEMDRIVALADEHNLVVVEDAAHAFGSTYGNKKIGNIGHITCFSFDPIKNITCGEGGAVIYGAAFDEQYRRAVKMRVLGMDYDGWSRIQGQGGWTYDVLTEGFRYHMPNFCAAIGLKQLEFAESFKQRKIEICKQYDDALSNISGIQLIPFDYNQAFPFMYVIRTKNRGDLMHHMKAHEICSGIHYMPNHLLSFCRHFRRDELSVTDQVGDEIMTLPLFTEMTNEEVTKVLEALHAFHVTMA